MAGFDNDTMFSNNVDFRGIDPIQPQVLLNGQLLIGSNVSPNIKVGFLTSNDASVIITNGSGTIDLSAGSSTPFNPAKVITDFIDFISDATGNMDWSISQSTFTQIDGTATNPGIWQIFGAASPGLSFYSRQSVLNNNPFLLGGGSLNLNFVFDIGALSDVTNTYTIYIGLMQTAAVTLPIASDNGIYFKYTDTVNSGNWQIENISSTVATTANTTTPASTGFHNYGIQINADASSVSFTIDGVEVDNSPISTNIPTATLTPAIIVLTSSGTSPDMFIDLYYYTQILTTSR